MIGLQISLLVLTGIFAVSAVSSRRTVELVTYTIATCFFISVLLVLEVGP